MKFKKFLMIILVCFLVIGLVGCSSNNTITDCDGTNHIEGEWVVVKEATCKEEGTKQKVCTSCKEIIDTQSIPLSSHKEELTSSKDATTTTEGYLEYTCSVCGEVRRITIPLVGVYDDTLATTIVLNDSEIKVINDNSGVVIENSTVTISKAGEYTLTGTINEGNIIVNASEDDKVILNLEGVNITSTTSHPIYIQSASKIEVSAKNETINYVFDKRSTTEADKSGAAIYAEVDMELKGKGTLVVESIYNNGIATKDDLEIKNLTLTVTAVNNAIKGNDSLTINSGTITAISTAGDCLKTENSDISSKGNQRGIITINDGTINLYAACDAIDASYDVVINGGTINIYTEKYSPYSEEVTSVASSTVYMRLSSRISLQSSCVYYVKYTLSDNTTVEKSGNLSQVGQTRYVEFDGVNNIKYIRFYIYSSKNYVGTDTYLYASDQLSFPSSFDTFYVTTVSSQSKLLNGSWTNYTNPQYRPGGGWDDGNSEEILYSCKGIKADNDVLINDGNINITSHDDAIHSSNDDLLDTLVNGNGNITINGGNIVISSDDDAIHADNILTITNGSITINSSYEGLEANTINIEGGTNQITSSDDAINAKSSLVIKSGVTYLNSDGDGLDSNGTIQMSGGVVLAQGPTNGGNGVIDYDRSFSFSGGLLVAIGASGMNQSPTCTTGNTKTVKTSSIQSSNYVVVTMNNEEIAVLKVTKSNQNYLVFAYNNSEYSGCSLEIKSSVSSTLVNNLYYVK